MKDKRVQCPLCGRVLGMLASELQPHASSIEQCDGSVGKEGGRAISRGTTRQPWEASAPTTDLVFYKRRGAKRRNFVFGEVGWTGAGPGAEKNSNEEFRQARKKHFPWESSTYVLPTPSSSPSSSSATAPPVRQEPTWHPTGSSSRSIRLPATPSSAPSNATASSSTGRNAVASGPVFVASTPTHRTPQQPSSSQSATPTGPHLPPPSHSSHTTPYALPPPRPPRTVDPSDQPSIIVEQPALRRPNSSPDLGGSRREAGQSDGGQGRVGQGYETVESELRRAQSCSELLEEIQGRSPLRRSTLQLFLPSSSPSSIAHYSLSRTHSSGSVSSSSSSTSLGRNTRFLDAPSASSLSLESPSSFRTDYSPHGAQSHTGARNDLGTSTSSTSTVVGTRNVSSFGGGGEEYATWEERRRAGAGSSRQEGIEVESRRADGGGAGRAGGVRDDERAVQRRRDREEEEARREPSFTSLGAQHHHRQHHQHHQHQHHPSPQSIDAFNTRTASAATADHNPPPPLPSIDSHSSFASSSSQTTIPTSSSISSFSTSSSYNSIASGANQPSASTQIGTLGRDLVGGGSETAAWKSMEKGEAGREDVEDVGEGEEGLGASGGGIWRRR